MQWPGEAEGEGNGAEALAPMPECLAILRLAVPLFTDALVVGVGANQAQARAETLAQPVAAAPVGPALGGQAVMVDGAAVHQLLVGARGGQAGAVAGTTTWVPEEAVGVDTLAVAAADGVWVAAEGAGAPTLTLTSRIPLRPPTAATLMPAADTPSG